MGAGITESEKERHLNGFSSTPVKSESRVRSPTEHKVAFCFFDCTLILVSLFAFILDTVTDVFAAVQYFRQADYWWGGLTLACVVVASVVIQVFSGRWYAADGKWSGLRYWLSHLLLLQPLERYLLVLHTGICALRTQRPETVEEYRHQQNDVCMLRLFEAFLESAPQFTLQMYIILCTNSGSWLTMLTAAVSLLAIGWAVASYTDALRCAFRDGHRSYWPGLILQTIWHMSFVISRVMALIAFASIFSYWLFLAIGVHWVAMSLWVACQDTNFGRGRIEAALFAAAIGAVYCYSYVNVREGVARWRILAFYTLAAAENGAMVAAWCLLRDTQRVWYDELVIAVVAVSFVVGVLCMLFHYRYCHPTGPIYAGLTCQSSTSAVADDSPKKAAVLSSTIVQDRVPSAVRLSRHSFIKPASARPSILYTQVSTPSQLSPISRCGGGGGGGGGGGAADVFTDCTLDLDAVNSFQHYTVGASACMHSSIDRSQSCRGDSTAFASPAEARRVADSGTFVSPAPGGGGTGRFVSPGSERRREAGGSATLGPPKPARLFI